MSLERLWTKFRRQGGLATRADVGEWLKSKPSRATELFQAKPTFGESYARSPNAEWRADLIDFRHKPESDGEAEYRHVMVVQNAFTRFVWAVPLESNMQTNSIAAFQGILENAEKPEALATDGGAEWGRAFEDFLTSQGIRHEEKDLREKGGRLSTLDNAIKLLKGRMAIRKEEFGESWLESLPKVVAEYNDSVNGTTGASPEELQVDKNPAALFFVRRQMAQRIEDNTKVADSRIAAIRKAGGFRELIAEKDREVRGPKSRGDTKKWGPTQELVDAPDAFKENRAHATTGHSAPLKLTIPSKPATSGSRENDLDFKTEPLEKPMRRVQEFIVNNGPITATDALDVIKEEPFMASWRGTPEQLFSRFDYLTLRNGWVTTSLDEVDGMPVKVRMITPAEKWPKLRPVAPPTVEFQSDAVNKYNDLDKLVQKRLAGLGEATKLGRAANAFMLRFSVQDETEVPQMQLMERLKRLAWYWRHFKEDVGSAQRYIEEWMQKERPSDPISKTKVPVVREKRDPPNPTPVDEFVGLDAALEKLRGTLVEGVPLSQSTADMFVRGKPGWSSGFVNKALAALRDYLDTTEKHQALRKALAEKANGRPRIRDTIPAQFLPELRDILGVAPGSWQRQSTLDMFGSIKIRA